MTHIKGFKDWEKLNEQDEGDPNWADIQAKDDDSPLTGLDHVADIIRNRYESVADIDDESLDDGLLLVQFSHEAGAGEADFEFEIDNDDIDSDDMDIHQALGHTEFYLNIVGAGSARHTDIDYREWENDNGEEEGDDVSVSASAHFTPTYKLATVGDIIKFIDTSISTNINHLGNATERITVDGVEFSGIRVEDED